MKKVLYWVFLRPLLWLFYKCFYRVKVLNRERISQEGRQVIICNHLCKMDPFVVGELYDHEISIMAKEEWFKGRCFSSILRALGAIPINRDKPALSSFKEGLTVLNDEGQLLIFPEGTRNKVDTNIMPIKQGAAFFAIKSKAPVIPVIIQDRPKMFKKTYAIVGEPFEFTEYYDLRLDKNNLEKCDGIIQEKMVALKKELDEYVDSLKKNKK